MNAEQYLMQGIRIANAIKGLLKEQERLSELATATGGFRFSSDPANSNKPQSAKFENYAVSKVDLENEIEADIKKYWQMHAEIRQTISQVDDMDIQTILRMRYLTDMPIEIIAKQFQVSRKTIERRLYRGHREVSKITGYPAPDKEQHKIAKTMIKEVYKQ